MSYTYLFIHSFIHSFIFLKQIKEIIDKYEKTELVEAGATSTSSSKGKICKPEFPACFGKTFQAFEVTLSSLKNIGNESLKFEDIPDYVKYQRDTQNCVESIEISNIVNPRDSRKFTLTLALFQQNCNQIIYFYKYFH